MDYEINHKSRIRRIPQVDMKSGACVWLVCLLVCRMVCLVPPQLSLVLINRS